MSLTRQTRGRVLPKDAQLVQQDDEQYYLLPVKGLKPQLCRVTVKADGTRVYREEVGKWQARYRDHRGIKVNRSTGCSDKAKAQTILKKWLDEVEKVKNGSLTVEELESAEHAKGPILAQIEAYIKHMKAPSPKKRPLNPWYIHTVGVYLRRLVADMGISRLTGITLKRVEDWMTNQKAAGLLAAETINKHSAALRAFLGWCKEKNRIAQNPIEIAPKLKPAPERNRRAFKTEEFDRLMAAAISRPTREVRLIRLGPRKGKLSDKVKPEVLQAKQRQGEDRALFYLLAMSTGLRVDEELGTRTVASYDREARCLWLDAVDAKNEKSADMPLISWVADRLEQHLDRRLVDLQAEAKKAGTPVPLRLPEDERLIMVPTIRTFDNDLAAAKIPKKDRRGRTLDRHCLRKTTATWLLANGAEARMVQAVMRHSSLSLTTDTYMDEDLLDRRKAMESMPEVKVPSMEQAQQTLVDAQEAEAKAA